MSETWEEQRKRLMAWKEWAWTTYIPIFWRAFDECLRRADRCTESEKDRKALSESLQTLLDEMERLRAALRPFSDYAGMKPHIRKTWDSEITKWCRNARKVLETTASAALQEYLRRTVQGSRIGGEA